MENNVLKGKITDAQLELLQFFASNPSDEEMEGLSDLMTRFRAKRATDAMNRLWDEKGWTEKDMDKMLNTHMRTPYDRSGAVNKPKKA